MSVTNLYIYYHANIQKKKFILIAPISTHFCVSSQYQLSLVLTSTDRIVYMQQYAINAYSYLSAYLYWIYSHIWSVSCLKRSYVISICVINNECLHIKQNKKPFSIVWFNCKSQASRFSASNLYTTKIDNAFVRHSAPRPYPSVNSGMDNHISRSQPQLNPPAAISPTQSANGISINPPTRSRIAARYGYVHGTQHVRRWPMCSSK